MVQHRCPLKGTDGKRNQAVEGEGGRKKQIIESSTPILPSSSTSALPSNFVDPPKKRPVNMSAPMASCQPEQPSKIEKIEAKLANFEKGFEKEEKLRAKLRYLQFFENFHVAPPSVSFTCTQCKEVEVVRKEVLYHTCPNSKGGACTHHYQGSSHATTNYKKEIEVQCMNQETHKKEWQEQEKSRQEVRQEIRREFNKQEQVRGRRALERNKDMVKLHQDDFIVNPNISRAQRTLVTTASSPPTAEQTMDEKSDGESGGKLLHGDSCKTCFRMNKLTGKVLPHSPNY